jgi:hypothetical protein
VNWFKFVTGVLVTLAAAFCFVFAIMVLVVWLRM